MSTLEAIAREVGVSRKTVSNVLNGKNKENWGSTALRAAKIREVAERVGYQPNVMARAIATGKSRVIGLVIRSTINEQWIQNGILEEMTLQGYTTKLLYLPAFPNAEELTHVVEQCAMWKVEGLVGLCIDEEDMPRLKKQMDRIGCPVTFVGGIIPEGTLGVFSDVSTAVRVGIEHLVQLGHRRIAFLAGTPNCSLTDQHLEAFQNICQEFDLPWNDDSVAFSDWLDADIISAAANHLFQLPQRPTAIFCNSGVQAAVVFSSARKFGLRVPEQLSVIGYAEDVMSGYTDPPMTALVQPTNQMGHLAVRQLLAYLENPEETPTQPFCLKEGIHLIVRNSTAPPENL